MDHYKYWLINQLDLIGDIINTILHLEWSDKITCQKYLKCLFPDHNVYHYVLKYLASILTDDFHGLMLVFHGEHDICNLIHATFDHESIKIGNDMRIIHHTEYVPVDERVIKKFTSHDLFHSRQLHECGEYIIPTFKFIGSTDQKELFDSCSETTKKRIQFIPCVDIDIDIDDDDLKKLSSAFLWLLELYLPIYLKEGLIVPDKL